MLAITKNTSGSSAMVKNHKFDQEKSRMDFARMVIMHNYPSNMAEHEYFEIFLNGLQPMFKLVSRNTVRSDVFQVHKTENERLYKHFVEYSGRITLWTADHQDIGYICLTSHFIHDNWELEQKYNCLQMY